MTLVVWLSYIFKKKKCILVSKKKKKNRKIIKKFFEEFFFVIPRKILNRTVTLYTVYFNYL